MSRKQKILDKLIFFNPFGAGDLFESREFVKETMKIIRAKEYFYTHNQPERSLKDIRKLGYFPFPPNIDITKGYILQDNNLYFNTWIGQNGPKGITYNCSVESIYRMFNNTLQELGFPTLSKPVLEYLPEIDYSVFQISGIDKFVFEHPRDKILICNGDALSGQAFNFNFTPSVLKLANKYTDKTFILTKKIPLALPNVFFTEDITKTSDGFDINEISYLSTFCKVLVGRYSGPHTCVQTKANWMDPTKRLVTFTYREPGSTFTSSPDVKMVRFWSRTIDKELVVQKISEAIERK